VYSLQAVLIQPVLSTEEVIGEKYRLIDEVMDQVNATITKFSLFIPPDIQQARDAAAAYVSELEVISSTTVTVRSTFSIYSSYGTLLICAGFGLVVITTILATLFALVKHRCVPACTVIFLIFTVLILTIISTATTATSVILVSECNQGLNNLTYSVIKSNENQATPAPASGKINIQNTACTSAALNHYLFCAAWNDTDLGWNPPCSDPVQQAVDLANGVIVQLKKGGPLFQKDIKNIENIIQTLYQINSCEDTRATYVDAKYTLCWDVSNGLMRVTFIALILQVVLLVFLAYLLHGWYRLIIAQTPPDAFFKDGVPVSVMQEALEILNTPPPMENDEQLVLLSRELTSSFDDSDHRFKRPTVTPDQRARAYQIVQMSRTVCHKYLSTVIWSVIMLAVLSAAFVLFFMWQAKYDEVKQTNC